MAYKKGWTIAAVFQSQLYKLNKEQDYVFYSNRIDIFNLLKDNSPAEFYRLSFLDFKKFIKFKKGFTNKELCKLFLKRYYNFINMCLQKGTDTLPPH